MTQIEPNSWSGQLSYFADVFSISAWVLMSAALSLFVLIFLKLFMVVNSRYNKHWVLLVISAAWVVCEAARMFVFSVLIYGDGGSIGLHWPLGVIGLPAMYSPLALLSKYIGLLGVSFVVVYINLQFAFWVYDRKRFMLLPNVLFAILLCGIMLSARYVGGSNDGSLLDDFRVEVVSFARGEYVDGSYLNRFSGSDLDLVILPEYSGIDETTDFSVLDDGTWVISTYLAEGMPSHNVMFAANKYGIQQTYDKNFLIASGEYLPYIIKWPLEFFGQKKLLYDFESAHAIAKGSDEIWPFEINGVKVGALACSGVVNGLQYGELVDKGSDALVNTASLSFLADGSNYHVTNKYLARYYSASSGLPFAQASRTGGSYIIE